MQVYARSISWPQSGHWAGKTDIEVAATVELADGLDGVGLQGAVYGALAALLAGLELGPSMVDNLPEGRGAGTSRTVEKWQIKTVFYYSFRSEGKINIGIGAEKSDLENRLTIQ